MKTDFINLLTGGNKNSLGNTVKVVNIVLKKKSTVNDLFKCYLSEDRIMKMRASNALKRVFREKPDWFKDSVPSFFKYVPLASYCAAEWTFAQLFSEFDQVLDTDERKKAISQVKKYIKVSDDWIVLNQSMKALELWSVNDKTLSKWLKTNLQPLTKDKRKSVSAKAKKIISNL
jgi:hypothetical protein